MEIKALRTFFLIFGLALVGLGLFYNNQQKEQETAARESKRGIPVEGFDTYTLENNQYEGEYSPQTEFMLLNETDSTFLLREEEPAVNTMHTAGFAEEFDLMEQERSLNIFPLLLIFSGTVLLFLVIFSFMRSTEGRTL